MIIYLATSRSSGKRYVGMTVGTLQRRMKGHRLVAAKGSKTPFHCAMQKYGFEDFVFEKIGEASSRDALQKAEIDAIKMHNTIAPHGYNITPGGDGFKGRHKPEAIEKMKASQRARRASESEEDRARRGAAISAAKKGKPQPWASAVGKSLKGRKRTLEFKAKVSASMKRVAAENGSDEMRRRAKLPRRRKEHSK